MGAHRTAVLAILLFGELAMSSCTGSSHGVKTGSTMPAQAGSRLTVHASASVVHSGITYTQRFGGRSVFATSSDGTRFTAKFNAHGAAVLSLPPGHYNLTTSVGGACNDKRLTVPPGDSQVRLICGLP